mmetsp:Transcript_17842/g.31405  ORF Transcript_17842/g.31405 Transcript_17842/m.31405 type:complete len:211 (-) Transcript_17842:134-766(-)
MSTCANSDLTSNYPDDVLHLRTVHEKHIRVCGLRNAPRCLNDEDSVGLGAALTLTIEGEIRGSGDANSDVKGVDTGRQSLAAEGAVIEITVTVGDSAPGGVSVRGLHVADRGGQFRGCGRDVVRRINLARDLCGCRKLPRTVHDQVKASNGTRRDGRDGKVASDDGGGNGRDASLGDDGVVFGSSKLDLIIVLGSGSIDHGSGRGEEKEI